MNNQHNRLKERLRTFIAANFYIPSGQALDENTSFLEQGIIDSTGVLEIVTFVESEFGIAVSDEELLPANFDSLAALSTFIVRKQQDVSHVLAG
jgi:acyl carrier protein